MKYEAPTPSSGHQIDCPPLPPRKKLLSKSTALLRLITIYSNKLSNFEKLLHKDNSVSVHHNNIHALAIEIYKVVNSMSPEILNEVIK